MSVMREGIFRRKAEEKRVKLRRAEISELLIYCNYKDTQILARLSCMALDLVDTSWKTYWEREKNRAWS